MVNIDKIQYVGFYFSITHYLKGFDDAGSQNDAYGVLVDWWEPETKKRYVEKTQCVIDQFSNFTVEVLGETLNLNGINTQGFQSKSFSSYLDPFPPGENVADLGGVKEAIRTYEKIVERFRIQPLHHVEAGNNVVVQ